MGVRNDKNIIRGQMLELRNSLTEDEVRFRSQNILEIFTENFWDKPYYNYMSYVGVGKEVDTKGIIKALLEANKKVSVPLCIPEDRELIASQIDSLEELKPSYFGLLEPGKDYIRPVDPKDIEVILVPGLAFDKKGNRLGYGKGYYDRFLKNTNKKALKIGLAFSFQILEKVPIESFDHHLDMIITDEEIIMP